MKPRIYLETTFVSYLTARLSRDLVVAAHQQLTSAWWETRRDDFDLYISQAVLREASVGDTEAAQRRLQALEGLALPDVTRTVEEPAARLPGPHLVPEKAAEDALHISLATVHGMDYLLTWNCKHIANAALRSLLEKILREEGFQPPVICTPEELMEAWGMWEDPIVNEVRKARDEHARRFQYDLRAICQDLREQQAQAQAAGRRIVNLEADRPRPDRRSSPAA